MMGELKPQTENVTDMTNKELLAISPLLAAAIILGVYPNLFLHLFFK